MDWKVQEGAREDGSDAPFPGYSKRASLASSGLPLLGGTVPTFQSVAYLSLAVPPPCPPSAPQSVAYLSLAVPSGPRAATRRAPQQARWLGGVVPVAGGGVPAAKRRRVDSVNNKQ